MMHLYYSLQPEILGDDGLTGEIHYSGVRQTHYADSANEVGVLSKIKILSIKYD